MSRKFTSSDKVAYVDETESTEGTVIHDSNLNNIQDGILYNNDEISTKASSTDLTNHNTSNTSHEDIRTLIEGKQDAGSYAHLVGGLIPSSELPSYVDDVIEGYYYNNNFYEDLSHTDLIVGETGKIYIDITNASSLKTYRYSGTGYTKITSGDVVVIDSIQDGNMNAVTSNAVYDGLSSKIDTSQTTTITFTKEDGTTGSFKVIDYEED